MRALRRVLPRMIPVLEGLDARVVPASIGSPFGGATALIGSLSPRFLPPPFGNGALVHPFNPGGFGAWPMLRPIKGLASVSVNAAPAQSSIGTGVPVTTPGVGLNLLQDHALGRQPVVVGLQGPGIGQFANAMAIQFLQGSAGLITPFNAVPGAGATFGIAFV